MDKQEVYAIANVAIDTDGKKLIEFLSRAREKLSEDAETQTKVEMKLAYLNYACVLRELVKAFAEAKKQQQTH